MENTSHSFESIIDNAGDYLETKVDLFKLKAVKRSSEITSSVVSILITVLVLILSAFILSIGLALWIGELIGTSYYGFLVLGGIYAIIGLVVYLCRKSLINKPVSNIVIKKILN